MEPRLNSRGNIPVVPLPVNGSSFNGAAAEQPRKSDRWSKPGKRGTRFNGAAAEQPRKYDQHANGPRAWGCFNGAAAEQPRKCARTERPMPAHSASMEPRLNSRGNVLTDALGNPLWTASMEPRLNSRGNCAEDERRDVADWPLQWSRG